MVETTKTKLIRDYKDLKYQVLTLSNLPINNNNRKDLVITAALKH